MKQDLTVSMSDSTISNFMVNSKDAQDWNGRRRAVLQVRSKEWVGRFVDANRLIKQTKFASKLKTK